MPTLNLGGATENFEFQMDDDTQVYRSCSATLNGELFVFGGYSSTNNVKKQVSFQHNCQKFSKFQIQVSKVIGCELKRIGDLSYDFAYGACGTYSIPEERIFLCFPDNQLSKCERLSLICKNFKEFCSFNFISQL